LFVVAGAKRRCVVSAPAALFREPHSTGAEPSPNRPVPTCAVANTQNLTPREEEDRGRKSPSSNVVNVDLAVAFAVVLAEVEANTALLLTAVGVGLVDLGCLGELAVGLE
jgi:hypothetical protein